MSACLSVCPSMCPSMYLSVCLFVCPSMCPFICPFMCFTFLFVPWGQTFPVHKHKQGQIFFINAEGKTFHTHWGGDKLFYTQEGGQTFNTMGWGQTVLWHLSPWQVSPQHLSPWTSVPPGQLSPQTNQWSTAVGVPVKGLRAADKWMVLTILGRWPQLSGTHQRIRNCW